ncbi:probable carboxylesterase 18 [Malania oleifera]|uniref:probable carboxylesterase 18 n=1 Tax=Malania oleifera TaxID=397392 RepID=UPI0025AEC70E|nr:probable carboxylesterase 18 [Malania oleifera]
MATQRLSSPTLPWTTKLVSSVLSAITDASLRPNGTLNRRLVNFLDFKSPANPSPVNGVSTSDVTVDAARKLWFRIFVPTVDAPLPVILFFHGGGFAFLSADSKAYDAVCRRFARKIPAVVVSVNYRLAPEHRFPSQYDDGFDVLKFLDEWGRLPENADPARCFVAGDSAGANLSHHVALRACATKFRRVKVVGVVAIQPFFGGEERTGSEIRLPRAPIVSVKRTDWMWKVFLPEGSDRDHAAANVCGPNSPDISRMEYPATLVFVGGMDPLQDWQRRYYDWVKRSGKEAYLIEYPNAIHAFYVFPQLPEASLLMAEVKDFVHKQSSAAAGAGSAPAVTK